MKTLLTFALILFTFKIAVCQITENNVEFKNIHIVNTAKKSYSLGSKADLQKAFGKATITKEPDEILGGFAYTYKYPGFETYFNEKNWEATIITGKQYTVILNKLNCKVGDKIDKFSVLYPQSYIYRDNKEKRIRIYISNKNVITDTYVVIDYDSKDIIKEIVIENNNS